jgi:hypothetical protein
MVRAMFVDIINKNGRGLFLRMSEIEGTILEDSYDLHDIKLVCIYPSIWFRIIH